MDNLLVNARISWRRLNRVQDATDWFDKAFRVAASTEDVTGSWLFSTPKDRSYRYKAAAEAFAQAGRPDEAEECLDAASREEKAGLAEG